MGASVNIDTDCKRSTMAKGRWAIRAVNIRVVPELSQSSALPDCHIDIA